MPSRSTLIALLALFVALGGPAEAAKLINGKKIRKGTVSSKQIKNRSLTSSDLSSATIRSLRATPPRSVGAAQILDGAVTLSKLAPGSFTGNQIADRSLNAIDLSLDTITGGEVAPNAIGNSELAADAVSGNKIRTGAVTKGKIGTNDVGTEEVIDADIRGVDLHAEIATVSLPPIPMGQCATADATVPALPAPPAPRDVTSDLVIVGQVSDELTLTGRATAPTTVRIKACNTSAGPVAATPNAAVPYLAMIS